MGYTIIATAFVLISNYTFAQNNQKDVPKVETKMDLFASKVGSIVKFVDYKLPNLKTSQMVVVETRIRKIMSNGEVNYFYQIEKQGQYTSPTASIEYSDLKEVIKAFNVLKSELNNDLSSNPNYLENKFTTSDGFRIGYYIDESKPTWFLKLEKYGTDTSVFIKDIQVLENAFIEALNKIEELKK